VVLFFDGSKSRDATALIGCTVNAGHVFTLGVWEPDPNDDNSTVDQADVDLTVMQAFENLHVVAFFADVREWEQFTLTAWPQQYKDKLKVWAAPQARPPQPIAWDMRGHSYEFAKATEACLEEIEGGAFTHDGNSAVARHMANARRRPYRDAVAIGKESPASPRKIDAAVCVIGARMVRRIVLGSGVKLDKRRRAVFF
jgi:phage terminase large subunit-like protein